MRWARLAGFAALLAWPAAAEDAGSIQVTQAWARATARAGATAGAFMTIVNRGGAADRLTGASCADAARTELHETVRDGDVMQMRPVGDVAVAPGQTVTLAPGGMHLMLVYVRRRLEPGQSIACTLTFEHAGSVPVTAAVEAAGAAEPSMRSR